MIEKSDPVFTRNMGPYIIKHEWWDTGIPCEKILMKSAYNEHGDYIGNTIDASRKVKKFGIVRFEKADPQDNVCSIGFNPDTKKWYGWSHRAISGFTGRNAKQKARRFAESVS